MYPNLATFFLGGIYQRSFFTRLFRAEFSCAPAHVLRGGRCRHGILKCTSTTPFFYILFQLEFLNRSKRCLSECRGRILPQRPLAYAYASSCSSASTITDGGLPITGFIKQAYRVCPLNRNKFNNLRSLETTWPKQAENNFQKKIKKTFVLSDVGSSACNNM